MVGTFQPSELKHPFSMLMIGKSKSGKTVLLHDIVSQTRKQFKEVFLFSKTGKVNASEFRYIPKSHIFTTLEHLCSLLDFQKNLSKKERKSILIILDDIISDAGVKSQAVKDLFILMRHYDTSVIFLSQAFTQTGGLSTVVRNNANWIVSFFIQNQKRRQFFIEEYMSIRSVKEGDQAFKEITAQPYTAVVINTLNTSARTFDDYLFQYRANPKIDRFVIGKESPVMFHTGKATPIGGKRSRHSIELNFA